MRALEWKQLPTEWINKDVMSELKWVSGKGSVNSSALMIFIALGVYTSAIDDPVMGLLEGEASPTYEELQRFCGLSRALISKGIKKLIALKRIEKTKKGVKIIYKLKDYNLNSFYTHSWGKVPFRYFSKKGVIRGVFNNLNVRNKSTLLSLKIYLMAIKYRSNKNNYATFSYDTIKEFTSMPKSEIKKALQILSHNNLLIIDMVPAKNNEYRQNIYRVYGVGNTTHLATISDDSFEKLVN